MPIRKKTGSLDGAVDQLRELLNELGVQDDLVKMAAERGNTGFDGKMLWGCLELLLVPLALGLGGSLFAIYLTDVDAVAQG